MSSCCLPAFLGREGCALGRFCSPSSDTGDEEPLVPRGLAGQQRRTNHLHLLLVLPELCGISATLNFITTRQKKINKINPRFLRFVLAWKGAGEAALLSHQPSLYVLESSPLPAADRRSCQSVPHKPLLQQRWVQGLPPPCLGGGSLLRGTWLGMFGLFLGYSFRTSPLVGFLTFSRQLFPLLWQEWAPPSRLFVSLPAALLQNALLEP